VARILVIGGGCRGRELARELVAQGHAVRITTRSQNSCEEIESAGAECFLGTPDRLATLRGALDGVTVACWLLSAASGPETLVRELHVSRLRFFLQQLIDTTVRGFVYERGAGEGEMRASIEEGERLARELSDRNAIPIAVLGADVRDRAAWMGQAQGAIGRLLDPAAGTPRGAPGAGRGYAP
jgi:hypothetical protein